VEEDTVLVELPQAVQLDALLATQEYLIREEPSGCDGCSRKAELLESVESLGSLAIALD